MAFHLHLVHLFCGVLPAGIAPMNWAEPRLSLQWDLDEGGRLRSRWTSARD